MGGDAPVAVAQDAGLGAQVEVVSGDRQGAAGPDAVVALSGERDLGRPEFTVEVREGEQDVALQLGDVGAAYRERTVGVEPYVFLAVAVTWAREIRSAATSGTVTFTESSRSSASWVRKGKPPISTSGAAARSRWVLRVSAALRSA